MKLKAILLALAFVVLASTAYAAPAKVLQVLDGGGYTYLEVSDNGNKYWVAAPQAQVKAGDSVNIAPGNMMTNFTSKALRRTFDSILFTGGVEVVKGGDSGSVKTAEAPQAVAGVNSVADVFAKKKDLNGKTITVRGKVVKVNTGIKKRNWLHLQDAGNKQNDLTVTTTQTANVGDTVTATGVLTLDRNLEGGYSYSALMENVTISK